MKGRRIVVYHGTKGGTEKGYAKEIGSVLLSDELAAYIDANNERIGVVLNMIPDVYYNAYPDRPRETESTDNGGF
jgi:hypothetical protein